MIRLCLAAAAIVWPLSATASMMELPLAPGMFPLGSGAVRACMVTAPGPETSGKMGAQTDILRQLKSNPATDE